MAWSQGIRKWVIFSRTRDFPDVYVIRSFCSSAEIVGFIPHDVRLWPRLGRCCWENEINQGGSTSALVPLPTLPPPSFRIYTQLNLYILGKSKWCPQPIQWSYFLREKTTMGGLVKGWTQSWWQIFEKRRSLIIWGQRINTKANTKCLFWAWDDRRNVRNFSMLIIMAVRPAFNWDFFVFSKYIFFREQAIHCGQNVCLSHITHTHIIFKKK